MRPLACCLGALVFVASTSYAGNYSVTATVNSVRSHDSDSSDTLDSLWFSLEGIKELGSCKTNKAGYVVFLFQGKLVFEVVLHSKTSGAPLQVWVDDLNTGPSGYCMVGDVELK
jgi:hypothetical protein